MMALTRKVVLLTVVVLLWTTAPGRAQTVEDFQLPTVMAGDLRLSDFRGRVVLLDFLASWCRPCKDAIPHLNQLQRDHGAKGLSVIGYSVDTGGLHAMKPFVVRNGVEFPVVLGTIQLVNPPSTQLQRGADGLFRDTRGPAQPDPTVQLASGVLEGSNVNPVRAMVQMLENTRAFEMQTKLMQNIDQNHQAAQQLLNVT